MVDAPKRYPRGKVSLEIEPNTWDQAKTADPAACNEFSLRLDAFSGVTFGT